MDITVSLAESENLGSDKIVYTHNPVVIDIDAGDSSLFGNYVNLAFAILDGTGNNADGTYRCLNPELCAGKAQADISSYLRELMEDYGGGITSAGVAMWDEVFGKQPDSRRVAQITLTVSAIGNESIRDGFLFYAVDGALLPGEPYRYCTTCGILTNRDRGDLYAHLVTTGLWSVNKGFPLVLNLLPCYPLEIWANTVDGRHLMRFDSGILDYRGGHGMLVQWDKFLKFASNDLSNIEFVNDRTSYPGQSRKFTVNMHSYNAFPCDGVFAYWKNRLGGFDSMVFTARAGYEWEMDDPETYGRFEASRTGIGRTSYYGKAGGRYKAGGGFSRTLTVTATDLDGGDIAALQDLMWAGEATLSTEYCRLFPSAYNDGNDISEWRDVTVIPKSFSLERVTGQGPASAEITFELPPLN